MRKIIARQGVSILVTVVAIPVLLTAIKVDPWLIVCTSLIAATLVGLWGLDPNPALTWKRRMGPILIMVLGGVAFVSGAVWYYAEHRKVPSTSAKAPPDEGTGPLPKSEPKQSDTAVGTSPPPTSAPVAPEQNAPERKVVAVPPVQAQPSMRQVYREHLKGFFAEGRTLVTQCPKAGYAPEEMAAYQAKVQAWYSKTEGWVGGNMGEAAKGRLLSKSNYISRRFSEDKDCNYLLNILEGVTGNLDVLIQSDAFDPPPKGM